MASRNKSQSTSRRETGWLPYLHQVSRSSFKWLLFRRHAEKGNGYYEINFSRAKRYDRSFRAMSWMEERRMDVGTNGESWDGTIYMVLGNRED